MGHKYVKQRKKLDTLILLALLLLFYRVGNTCCVTVHENSIDMHALLDFKRGISSDPNGALSNWNNNTHFCRWNGVNCTVERPYRVRYLTLNSQSLVGQISSSLGNLTFLSILDLSNNSLIGPLPLIRNLQKLQKISLFNNQLNGIIHTDAFTNCSNLVVLDLGTNFLTGLIPTKIGFLPNLMNLFLDGNNFTGTIPPTLGNASSLVKIQLSNNKLQGNIPDELGQLSNLSWLVLNQNLLSGKFQPALLNLSSLKTLDLGLNMLSDMVPPNIGNTLKNLVLLTIGSNMFKGPIPHSLGNISGLEKIDFAFNNFTGEIPSSFGNLSNLTTLFLSNNMLHARDNQEWEFLNALTNCHSLKILSVQNNWLHGVIPNSIGNLSINLINLKLGGNNLSGIVPQSIGNLTNLISLVLHNNYLSGTIGEWVGNLKKLQGLYLSRNNFVGPVPSSFSNLLQLTELTLDKNELEGPIPPSIGNIEKLITLNLSFNKFQGNIPPSFGNLNALKTLDISHNKLQGDIPIEIGNLKLLTELYLSSNKLIDQIPDTLGQCVSLTTVAMDNNFLTGDIPLSFGNLSSLMMLNLSHNNISGIIPITLSDLPLLLLDLSYNDFQGHIPTNGVFANATAVSINGNKGLCGGVVNLHMPACPTASKKTEKQYYLIRVLIPLFGFMSLVVLIYFVVLLMKKMPRNTYFSHPSFGENFPKVSYEDLAQATRNFTESNIVGRGSCGLVYSGKLKEPEMDVAVKVFDMEVRTAERNFMSECEALRSVQHRNLLPIITACSTVDGQGNVFKALVYELMPNGNLDTWLHHKGEGKSPKWLGLSQRISIAVNIADALDYLHHDCGRPTIHCDLKPSNILLNDDMTALLGDFGIARFYLDSPLKSAGSITSVGVRGTIGYIAPEYAGGGPASISGDVYSFGVVLLEMMTGKRPTDPMFKDGLDIINFVESHIPDQIVHVIDCRLIEESNLEQAKMSENDVVYQCLMSLLEVAISCTRALPSERMNMKQTANKMHEIKTSYLGRKAKKV